jgi:hypothetical protein
LEGFAESLLNLMGMDLQLPSYTQICRRQAALQVPMRIRQPLRQGEAIHMVVDSSGLKIYGEHKDFENLPAPLSLRGEPR